MTNEEAKEILAIYRFNLIQSISNQLEGDIEALNMAIKALEQQPCDDCISRQAVIDGLNKYIDKAQNIGTKDDFISFMELVIKQLPSVTPKTESLKEK